MGRSKALLPLPGSETFLSRIVHTLLDGGADDVVIVVGHDAQTIAQHVESTGLLARVVVNAAYETGQLSSVLAALSAIDRPGVRAFLMTLVDVPLVAASTVRAVLERYRATGVPIVRPVRGNAHGHPVLIDRSLFEPLRSSDASLGARSIVRAHASPTGDVAVDDEGAFLDIDTPEEYARAFGTTLPATD
jgi:molybdenum cofactor cytidylyltransferase